MIKLATKITGCFELKPKFFRDDRGSFVKSYQKSAFRGMGLETDFTEDFYSTSKKGVLRGFHFQIPPKDQQKVVYCIRGRVLDVVLDLRKSSSTYGIWDAVELDGDRASALYIPKGLAHAFYSLTDESTLAYKVSAEYSPEHDLGILWNSVGVTWPDPSPIISARDAQFSRFENFESPFP